MCVVGIQPRLLPELGSSTETRWVRKCQLTEAAHSQGARGPEAPFSSASLSVHLSVCLHEAF